jgi:hypothetical protein
VVHHLVVCPPAVPLCAQALVPAFRIDGVDPTAKVVISSEVYAAMFVGNITYWDDPRFRALNPTLALPHKRIVLIGRGCAFLPLRLMLHPLSLPPPCCCLRSAHAAHRLLCLAATEPA